MNRNRLTITIRRSRPSGPSTDTDVKAQLKAVLLWDPDLSSSAIDLAVIDHVVYLSGAVESGLQKAEAQDDASRTKGVVSVVNHLKVEPAYEVSYYGYPDYLGYGWPYYDYNQSPDYFSEGIGPRAFLSDETIKKNIEKSPFGEPVRAQPGY